jgi:hypothetical protein
MHLVDAEELVRQFARSDPRMPLLIFALLSIYLRRGPFEFDAAALSRSLSDIDIKARMNPEEVASLEPEVRRFFDFTPAGLKPKHGVLTAKDA